MQLSRAVWNRFMHINRLVGSNEYDINVVSLFMAPGLSFKCVIEGCFQFPDLHSVGSKWLSGMRGMTMTRKAVWSTRETTCTATLSRKENPTGNNPGMQSEKQVINGRTKDTAQHRVRRNYCREDRGSTFQRNIDNHEPGCLAFICTDLFLIFHDVISNYRT
jgi:hypothetical protein